MGVWGDSKSDPQGCFRRPSSKKPDGENGLDRHLPPSRAIPFDKLGPSQSSFRRIKDGDRPFRALRLPVKRRRPASTGPRIARENMLRVVLHPPDQFRAFRALRTTGPGEDGNWLEDPALFDHVVTGLPHGFSHGRRRLAVIPSRSPMSKV